MMSVLSARSQLRFPSIDGRASCELHARQGVACTPMDCEYFRVAPKRHEPVGKRAVGRERDERGRFQ